MRTAKIVAADVGSVEEQHFRRRDLNRSRVTRYRLGSDFPREREQRECVDRRRGAASKCSRHVDLTFVPTGSVYPRRTNGPTLRGQC
jgi:hypothetical protein